MFECTESRGVLLDRLGPYVPCGHVWQSSPPVETYTEDLSQMGHTFIAYSVFPLCYTPRIWQPGVMNVYGINIYMDERFQRNIESLVMTSTKTLVSVCTNPTTFYNEWVTCGGVNFSLFRSETEEQSWKSDICSHEKYQTNHGVKTRKTSTKTTNFTGGSYHNSMTDHRD